MLEPLFARVLMKRDELKPKSGLILPDAAKKRNAPSRGVVVAKGPTAAKDIHVGDTYIFGMHAGVWLNQDGTVAPDESKAEFYILQDEDLLARVKP